MNRVTIINRALSRIGCLAVQSEAEPGPAGVGVLHTYDSVLEDLLSKYPWHFAKRFAGLTRLAKTPPKGWRSAFMLPPDRLDPPRAYYEGASEDRPTSRFELALDEVYADSDTLFAEYRFRADPRYWPGYFRELVVLALAAEYALEIREEVTLRDRLRRDCYGPPEYQGEGGQFAVAAALDAQSQPGDQPAGGFDPLTSIRHGYDDDDARSGWQW